MKKKENALKKPCKSKRLTEVNFLKAINILNIVDWEKRFYSQIFEKVLAKLILF
jgi:hypothetical protein